jgi:hypothetical protein
VVEDSQASAHDTSHKHEKGLTGDFFPSLSNAMAIATVIVRWPDASQSGVYVHVAAPLEVYVY